MLITDYACPSLDVERRTRGTATGDVDELIRLAPWSAAILTNIRNHSNQVVPGYWCACATASSSSSPIPGRSLSVI
jgi:hypothetical protein